MKRTSSNNLKSILKQGENSKIEFKEKLASIDRAMVAFANSEGGKIYLGITDKGEVKGVKITNEFKSQIESIARNCDPKISILMKELKKEKILVVDIKESKNKPHRCSSGFYVRQGSTSQKLDVEEIKDLMVYEGKIKFDTLTCKEFDYNKHFDKVKFYSFLERTNIFYRNKNILQLLEHLKIAKKQGDKFLFNNTGALFFAKNLGDLFYHTEISCVLFKGNKRKHVLDRKRFNEDLIANVEESLRFLEKNLRLEYKITSRSPQREEILELPKDALREALINAVTHRDYFNDGPFVTVEIFDDRVEICNFGGLPKGITKEELGKGKSVPRNHLIAELMLRAGYIERMGMGIQNMRELMIIEKLEPIEFKFTNFTTLTFPRKLLDTEATTSVTRRASSKACSAITTTSVTHVPTSVTTSVTTNVTANLKVTGLRLSKLLKILNFIDVGKFSVDTFAKNEKINRRTILRDIKLLKEKGLVVFEGSSKIGQYKITEKYKKLKKKL